MLGPSFCSGDTDEEKRITVRLPAELHERLAAQATRDHRSVNGEIVHLLEAALADPSADGESR
ncbi:Arc family DNA-binding protein [Streptomyces sp. NBC_01239]|uniref:Arc family DNA-binding protein n=1 Tax=Streptomyces sp. NBC_01239 TaxID=2903792 RepID=UPI00225A1E78|nr:Arc family DNA-binding protein [Streptomyces sp. NBC_01239]MCX4812942.1 Arc family DNA-binding protein [Streptomyces sp. NBC_01239]